MNVIVLAGGLSTERNVSLSSGSLICKALQENGHRAVMVDVFLGLENFEGPIENIFNKQYEENILKVEEAVPDIEKIISSRKGNVRGYFGARVLEACSAADVVFIALHGDAGEDGRIQAALELMDIKYTGSEYLGCAISMDKSLAKIIMRDNGIRVPNGIIADIDNKDKDITLPCVIKPCSGGSSIGVSIVNTREELDAALNEAFKYEEKILVEEYIKGREFSVGVLNEKALPPIEIIPVSGFYDYKNKYQAGLTKEICPAQLDDDIAKRMMDIAAEVHSVLKLGTYSRMDFILSENKEIYCLEANTLPGMTPTSLLPQEAAAVGISYNELCEILVNSALKKGESK